MLAILGGGGGFYAAWSGLLPIGGGSDSAHPEEAEHAAEGHGPAATVAFLELPQLIASLGPGPQFGQIGCPLTWPSWTMM